MDFLSIQRNIQDLKLDIFTLNDLIKITGQKKEVVKTKLTLLVKQEKIYRLKKEFYTLNKIENKMQLQKLYANTYIGLHSALEYYESTTQRFNNLDLITKNVLLRQKILGTQIDFHKVKKQLFFGYEKIKNTEVFISDIEKTIIDCVYFSSKIYLSEVKEFIRKYREQINVEKLKIYLNKINSSTLNKRTGYLLEMHGLHIDGLKINGKYEKLNKNLSSKGKKDLKWKLIINEEI